MATSISEMESGSDGVDKYCDPCKNSGQLAVAVVYCRTCKQFQCGTCNGMHKLPTLAKHSIIDVEDSLAGKGEIDMQYLDRCREHKKRFKFYCQTDNELCCSTCAISSHISKCGGVDDIDSLIDTNEEQMQKIKSKIQDQNFTSAVLTSSSSNMKIQLRKDQADKLKKIHQAKGKVIQLFDSFESEFKEKADEAIRDIELDMDSEHASRKEIGEQRDTMDIFLDKVASEGSPRQIFTTVNIYNKRLEQVDEQLRKSCEKLSTLNIDFSFNEHLVNILDMTEKIGEISVEKKKVYEPLELHEAATFNLKPSGKEKEPLYTGLDFMPDGRIVAVDNKNHKCVIMDEQLSVLSQSKVQTCPYDVAVIPENKIAVSSGGNRLSTYTVNQDNTLTKLNTITTTSKLFSLCTLDDKTLVASTVDTEGPAKKVAITGEETDFNLPWQSSRYAPDQSKTTYIPSLDMLVLTDRQANRCYLWNVQTRTKIVVEDERIKEPMGVCATSSGVIFVCSGATHSIVQISPTGEVLGSTRLSVYGPYSVAVSHNDKRLAVFNCAKGAKKLRLFNIR